MIFFFSYSATIFFLSESLGSSSVMITRTLVESGDAPAARFRKSSYLNQSTGRMSGDDGEQVWAGPPSARPTGTLSAWVSHQGGGPSWGSQALTILFTLKFQIQDLAINVRTNCVLYVLALKKST